MALLTESDCVALNTLDAQTQQLVEKVKTSKRPLVITRQGEADVLLIDAEDYEWQQRRFLLMEKIAQGKQDIAEGRFHTQEEVEAMLDSWLPDE